MSKDKRTLANGKPIPSEAACGLSVILALFIVAVGFWIAPPGTAWLIVGGSIMAYGLSIAKSAVAIYEKYHKDTTKE